jgi:L-galactose dehydrogenase
MLYRTLGSTALSVSQIGFGASPLGDVFGTTDPAQGVRAVQRALDGGINLFDVSPYYGNTLAEERLGKALSGVRNQVILATKCGRYGPESIDFSAARIKRSIDESLARLRTDYVDLFQAHDIEFGDVNQIIHETIPALREVQKAGKARFIGITGYPLGMLASVAEQERVDTILSYCRYDLLVSDLDTRLTPLARSKRIGLINASPLHMGLLTEAGPPSWHPAPQQVVEAAAKVVRLCRDRGVNPALVALRFSLNHPYVASTLVGMSTPEQVATNLTALAFELSPAFLRKIEQAVGSAKDVVWPSGRPENADLAVPDVSSR